MILLLQVSITEHIWPEALSSNLNPKLTLCVIALFVQSTWSGEICRPLFPRQLNGARKSALKIFVLSKVSPNVVPDDGVCFSFCNSGSQLE